MGFRRSLVRIQSPRLDLRRVDSRLAAKVAANIPGAATPGNAARQTLRFTRVLSWCLNRRFVMTKKPFFRAFDGCWYAQIRTGGKRKQVKLLDQSGDPIRGRKSEEDAFRAFHKILAKD